MLVPHEIPLERIICVSSQQHFKTRSWTPHQNIPRQHIAYYKQTINAGKHNYTQHKNAFSSRYCSQITYSIIHEFLCAKCHQNLNSRSVTDFDQHTVMKGLSNEIKQSSP